MTFFELEEIYLCWGKNKKLTVPLFLLAFIGIICIGIAIALNIQTGIEVEKYKEVYEDIQFYSIMDNFVGKAEAELQEPANVVKFKAFLELLNNSEYFDYFMVYDNPVYIENYKGREENVDGYEHNVDVSINNEWIHGKDGVSVKGTQVKGFWMGHDVDDFFNLELSAGRGFNEKDCILNPNKPISVILGSNYEGEYEIGEHIYIDFIFSEQEAEIIGFFKEGTNIYYRSGNYRNLDRYVIMPIFMNDDYNGEGIYNFSVNHFYTLRNSGILATKLSSEDIRKIIEEYSKEAGFLASYYVSEYDATAKETFGIGIETIQFLITLIVLLAISISSILLAICFAQKVEKDKRYYAILMMNGSTRKQIYKLLLAELFLILMSAYFFGGISIAVLAEINSLLALFRMYAILFLGTVLFGLVPGIISTLSFFRSDLINYMNEEIEYISEAPEYD